jgi:hypothetical protein
MAVGSSVQHRLFVAHGVACWRSWQRQSTGGPDHLALDSSSSDPEQPVAEKAGTSQKRLEYIERRLQAERRR